MRYIRVRNGKILQISQNPIQATSPTDRIYSLNIDHNYVVLQDDGTPRPMTEQEINDYYQMQFNKAKSNLTLLIHQKRKQLENLGITLHTSAGDYIVDTSQIGRSNLQGTILTYEIGNLDKTSDAVPWKFENGFLELNYNQLKEISAFVTDYIEKLFLAEKQHYDAIEQLTTIEEIQNYDLDQFWPSNEYNSQTI